MLYNTKMKNLLFFLLILLVCCSSDQNGVDETNENLLHKTFKIDGLEEITAIDTECATGGDGILESAVTQQVITMHFATTKTCDLTIDGQTGLCSWQAVDGNTITMDTTTEEELEMNYSIDSGINVLTLTLTSDWMQANCTSGN